jgi:hypothetical protein
MSQNKQKAHILCLISDNVTLQKAHIPACMFCNNSDTCRNAVIARERSDRGNP